MAAAGAENPPAVADFRPGGGTQERILPPEFARQRNIPSIRLIRMAYFMAGHKSSTP
jgi:hypothetical protein